MTQPPNITESGGPLVVDIPPGCGRERMLARLLRWPKIADEVRRRAERRANGQRTRRPRIRPPDGLRTPAEAAAKLGCSTKTLDGYVSTGALHYVALGHGKKRQRKMFSDPDLDAFITAQTRKDSPCPSTAGRARPTGTSTFTGEVIDFTGPRKPPRDAKPRK
jgi:hypothetical protein